MTKVFFTYVWGPPGNPAWPMTFASKAARSHARKVLTEGDLVFTIGTKGEPTAPQDQGRVLGVFRVSDLEVNTQDYGLPRRHETPEFDSVTRFPYALHPIAVWEIIALDNKFAELVGPLTPNHHLQAQSKVVELYEITAEPLLGLDRQEVPPALPKTDFGKGLVAQKNSKLAPKHQGSYTGTFGDHDIWYVYTLVMRDAKKKVLAVKVGYSNAPKAREAAHNGPLAEEVTGLRWRVEAKQPTASEDTAREIEQAVLAKYEEHKLASNGEILSGVDPLMVAADIGTLMRSRLTE
ncbi:hypothetical protein ACM25N_04525 [Roseovarius sp. C7]|uniref:hypothetical protein n=1 Tax=Roseovarius sp. C7 TaxID=3398643 RepID=UPI0039F4DB24